jgi:simple sugar transport system permease protein
MIIGDILTLSLLASMVRYATPLILAALGGMYSERGGVINIALEGIMLSGAFTASAVAVKTHNPWIGLIAAAAAGLLVALIHAVASIQFKADQVVVGTAINILFLGIDGLHTPTAARTDLARVSCPGHRWHSCS